MGWSFTGASGQRSGVKRDFVTEGNVPILVFKDEPERVRFLLEWPNFEAIAKEHKITVPEAEELVSTQLYKEKWLMPLPVWEHNIPAIPQKRFFSVVACAGKKVCRLCAENAEAEANGVTENKLKPYPYRREMLLPAWCYRLKRVLYIKRAQEFFDEVGSYLKQHGTNVDFDVFRTGQGFNTKYRAIFLGPSKLGDKKVKVMLPGEMNLLPTDEELGQRLGELPAFPPKDKPVEEPVEEVEEDEPVEEPVDEPVEGQEDPGSYQLTFGTHKGKTLRDLYEQGEEGYLQFLFNNARGDTKDKVVLFFELLAMESQA